MKHKRLSLSLVIVAAFFLLIYHGFSLVQINDSVREAVLKKVAPYLDGRISIDRLSLGWFSVHVMGLYVTSPDSSYEVNVRDLQISFNPTRLIKTKFDFTKSVNEIAIIHPAIALRIVDNPEISLEEKGSYNKAAPTGAKKVSRRHHRENAIDFRNFPVRKMAIRDGALSIADKELKLITVSDIAGLLLVDSIGYTFTLNGSLPLAKQKIEIYGNASPSFSSYEMRGKVDSLPLEAGGSVGNVRVKQGMLAADFHLTKHTGMSLQFADFSAGIRLYNGFFTLNNGIELGNAEAVISIADNTVFIKSLKCELAGISASITGTVSNLFNPMVALMVDLESREHSVKGVKIDDLGASLSIKGDIDEIEIYGNAHSASVQQVRGISLRRPYISVLTHGDSISLQVISGSIEGGKLSGHIALPTRNPHKWKFDDISYDLRLRGSKLNVSDEIGVVNLASLVVYSGKVNKQPTIKSVISFDKFRQLGSFTSTFEKGTNGWNVSLGNDSAFFAMTGRIDIKNAKPSGRLYLSLQNAPLLGFMSSLSPEIRFSGDAQLNIDKGYVKCISNQRISGKSISGPLYLTGNFDSEDKNGIFSMRIYSDSLSLFGRRGEFTAAVSGDKKGMGFKKIRFGKWLKGDVSLGFGRSYAGKIELAGFEFQQKDVIQPFVEDGDGLAVGGTINGILAFSGRPDDLNTEVNIDISDGYIGKASDISAKIKGAGTASSFLINTISLQTPKQKILWSDSLRLADGRISGKIETARLNLTNFWPDSSVNGLLSVKLDASYSGKTLIKIVAERLVVGDIKVNTFTADISEANGIGTINTLSFAMPEISGTVEGFFPLPLTSGDPTVRKDSLNIVVAARGNIMKEFAPLMPFLKKESKNSCQGAIRINFVNSAKGITVAGGYIDFSKDPTATIYPSLVFGRINNFKMVASFDNGQMLLDAEGVVKGKKIKITGNRAKDEEVPLYLDKLNLDIGVIRVETPDGPLTANAPFFMHDGEVAEFDISGRNGTQGGLVIAGPLAKPLIKGDIRIRNGRFTFPFVKKSDVSSNANFNLDLLIKPGQNLKYYYFQNAVTPWLDKVFANQSIVGVEKTLSKFFQYPLTELELDRQSYIHVYGSPRDKSMRLKGRLASYKGYVHYAGNDFKNDIEVELEFDGSFDLRPIISGSAMALIRPENKLDVPTEITIRLFVKDPNTGVDLPRGRLNEIKLVPSSTDPFVNQAATTADSYKQLIGNSSSGVQGNITRLAASEGMAMFEKVVMQRLFSNYVERAVLGFGRERLNPIFGANVTPDVFRIEIESNNLLDYSDMTLWNWQQLRRDLLGKTEFITGKYFFDGSLFLNYSSQLDLADSPDGFAVEGLRHRLGFELTPWRYLHFNMDYDIGGLSGAPLGVSDPSLVRSSIRLRLPLRKIQDVFEK